MKILGCIGIVLLISCTDYRKNTVGNTNPPEVLKQYEFVDSLTLRDKILAVKSEPYEHRLYVHVYKKVADGLLLTQALDSLDTQFGATRPEYDDFNADSLLDFKISSGIGARMSNVFFYLFVQDQAGHFTMIKGTEGKPNLHYDTINRTLTSIAYWSGATHINYKIENDSLISVQGVDIYFEPPNWIVHKHYSFLENGEQVVVDMDSVAYDQDSLSSKN